MREFFDGRKISTMQSWRRQRPFLCDEYEAQVRRRLRFDQCLHAGTAASRDRGAEQGSDQRGSHGGQARRCASFPTRSRKWLLRLFISIHQLIESVAQQFGRQRIRGVDYFGTYCVNTSENFATLWTADYCAGGESWIYGGALMADSAPKVASRPFLLIQLSTPKGAQSACRLFHRSRV
jgi:hypothetical protein